MSNVYETPKANLVDESWETDQFGSIEKGVLGDYEFNISDVISEAWDKTRGAKGTFFLSFLVYIAISIAISIPLNILMMVITKNSQDQAVIIGFTIFQQLVLNLAILPLMMGIMILGIRRSAGASLPISVIFGQYSKAFSFLFTIILMYLMIFIGLLLFVLPGIYLMFSYYMALPLVAEKGLSPWQALEVSRKTITKRWFTMFLFTIVITVILIVSIIPLGIGLIWTMPVIMIAYGIVYRNMFGIHQETLTD